MDVRIFPLTHGNGTRCDDIEARFGRFRGKWQAAGDIRGHQDSGLIVGIRRCLNDKQNYFMYYKNIKRILSIGFILAGLLFTTTAHAQKYKTLSDTTSLNKEYGEISLEISKLNTKLIEEKNKTADYRSKTSSSAVDAAATGQASKDQADVATSGNTSDTKKAVTDAKEADKKANDAKDAVSVEKKNNKKIKELTAQIDQKQKLLRELDSQRAAIMTSSSLPVALADSVHRN
jgi:hypothetical protein